MNSSGIGQLDFLSLDVEGFEAEALRGLDLKNRPPALILVEANFPEQIESLLGGYYERVATLGVCDWLLKLRR